MTEHVAVVEGKAAGMTDRADDIEASFRWQAEFCRGLDAPFTGAVLDAAADCIAARGPLYEIVESWRGDPIAGALALRIAAAIQTVARGPGAGALADLYSAPTGDLDRHSLSALIDEAVLRNPRLFKDFVARAVQTNEVRRTAALLGGFLEIANRTSMPLDLYEIGASGGLLLGWDRYRYDFRRFAWGKPAALEIASEWRGPLPCWPADVTIAGRQGCDIYPVDYDNRHSIERAASYIWPEHSERRARFLAAVTATRGIGAVVEKADAAAWLRSRLRIRQGGAVAVVFQSVMEQYLTPDARAALQDVIAAAAGEASADRPAAHLRFEPDPVDVSRFAVDLTLWPGGEKRRLAYAHPHGAWVEWLGA